ncbi:MAG: PaaI family thioesterase [Acidimicrobiales bacterium]
MTLDAAQLQRLVQDSFPEHDVPRVEEAGDGVVVMSLEITDRHGRPGGTVSGPAMMMLADSTAWVVVLSAVGPQLLAVTTSLHIDFLRRPPIADLVARGRLLKLGRSLAVIDVELTSRGSSDLLAKAQVTYSLPPGAGAPG